MRRPALLFALASLSLLSCVDADPAGPGFPAISTASESSTILDGANGGNPHFFFLPPLVKNPKVKGELNKELLPSVEICALREDGVGCAATQPDGLPIVFTSGAGPNGVRLSGRHYGVDWQVRNYDLDPATNYRIRVFAVEGGEPLGHIDVNILGKGEGSNGMLGVAPNRTLPIHFRIEEGASCTFGIDCVEAVVGPEGGTVVTPEEFAGVEIPPGALDGEVLIIIERIDVSVTPCLPTDFQQAEGCYRFDTEPALSEVQLNEAGEFNEDVIVGVCLDPDVLALEEHHQYALHKFDPDDPESEIEELPSAPAPFVDCTDFEALALESRSPFLRLARAGWERIAPVARLLGPSRAYAVNLGFGGVVRSFSQIGWLRGMTFEVIQGEEQSGPAGATLEIDPAVRVTATHWDPAELESAPVIQGVVVTFTFTDPDEVVTVVEATTNSDGVASVPWVLGPTPGVNTLGIGLGTTEAVAIEAIGEEGDIDIEGAFNDAVGAMRFAYAGGLLGGNVDNLDNVATISALLSDEAYHSGTFTTRSEIDRRSVPAENFTSAQLFVRLHRARALLASASALLTDAAEDPALDGRIPELLAYEGYTYIALAENYCSGVPTSNVGTSGELVYGTPQSTADMLTAAVVRFDEALALVNSQPEPNANLRNLALLGRARAQLGLQDFAAAAASAASVSSEFLYGLPSVGVVVDAHQLANGFYVLNTVQRRISVSDAEGGNGLDFVDANDPRVPVALDEQGGFNGVSTQYNFTALSATDAIPLGSGREAQLIVAEVELSTGNLPAALSILNTMRSNVGMPALTFVDTDVLFRERGFWLYGTGQRMSDLRRLVRQYDRPQDAVFPTGEYPLGGGYGGDVNLPVPADIGTCINREA